MDANKPSIYIVDDDRIFSSVLLRGIKKWFNLPVQSFESPEEILKMAKNGSLAGQFCLITDMAFGESGFNGLKLIEALGYKYKNFPSLVITGFGCVEGAIEATKKGVHHYLMKPFELSELGKYLLEIFDQKFSLDHHDICTEQGKSDLACHCKGAKPSGSFTLENPTQVDIFCGMIGRSNAMRRLFQTIEKVSATDSTVLICGESGTGKELVARALHSLSLRQTKEQVSINCGAIPGELLESELFGHIKGSFTGATYDKKGRFELANQGTIFLDEIGDMPLLLQVKLLRVLQARVIERVGEGVPIPVDVRIIAATHRNLQELVSQGVFREDLFYRLNVVPLTLPPLSKRKEDIPLLISFFRERFAMGEKSRWIDFDDEALNTLCNYRWPGNIRELENLVERLVALKGGGVVRVSDLPPSMSSRRSHFHDLFFEVDLPDEGLNLKETLEDIETSLIQQALSRTFGNKKKASELLQMNRTTLIEKIKKKKIEVDLSSLYS